MSGKPFKKEIPEDFTSETVKTIQRLDSNHHVIGILFLRRGALEFYTVPEIVAQRLFFNLPQINEAMRNAVAEITADINDVNPIVDRIMDDESVEGVVMTNTEGAPILTNVSLTNATTYGQSLNRLAILTNRSIKELDIFDEVLIVRMTTKKNEIMLAPNKEFNVIVIQRARRKVKDIQRQKTI